MRCRSTIFLKRRHAGSQVVLNATAHAGDNHSQLIEMPTYILRCCRYGRKASVHMRMNYSRPSLQSLFCDDVYHQTQGEMLALHIQSSYTLLEKLLNTVSKRHIGNALRRNRKRKLQDGGVITNLRWFELWALRFNIYIFLGVQQSTWTSRNTAHCNRQRKIPDSGLRNFENNGVSTSTRVMITHLRYRVLCQGVFDRAIQSNNVKWMARINRTDRHNNLYEHGRRSPGLSLPGQSLTPLQHGTLSANDDQYWLPKLYGVKLLTKPWDTGHAHKSINAKVDKAF